MKKLLVGLAALVAFAGCGTSPQQLCKDMMKNTCNKVFTCYTGAELDAVKAAFGSTEADCVTKLTASGGCNRSDFDTKPCDTGKTYDSAAASTCSSKYAALSCTDMKAGTTPSECNTICK